MTECSQKVVTYVSGMSVPPLTYYEEAVAGCLADGEAALANTTLPASTRLSEAERQLDRAKAACEELQQGLFLFPVSRQSSVQKKCEKMREAINELENECKAFGNREHLLGGNYDFRRAMSVDESLAKTEMFSNESVEIGQGIISDLNGQEERLMRARHNTDLIHGSVAKTSHLVGKMSLIKRQQTRTVWAVVALLGIAIICIIYIKLF
jgi:hypothetical protein